MTLSDLLCLLGASLEIQVRPCADGPTCNFIIVSPFVGSAGAVRGQGPTYVQALTNLCNSLAGKAVKYNERHINFPRTLTPEGLVPESNHLVPSIAGCDIDIVLDMCNIPRTVPDGSRPFRLEERLTVFLSAYHTRKSQ